MNEIDLPSCKSGDYVCRADELCVAAGLAALTLTAIVLPSGDHAPLAVFVGNALK
jgi:hypothetical protein